MPSNFTNSNNVMTNTNQLIAAVAIALVIAFLAGIGIGSGGKVPTHSPQNIKQTDTVYGRFGSVVKSLHH
jgi:hypothetical protein